MDEDQAFGVITHGDVVLAQQIGPQALGTYKVAPREVHASMCVHVHAHACPSTCMCMDLAEGGKVLETLTCCQRTIQLIMRLC